MTPASAHHAPSIMPSQLWAMPVNASPANVRREDDTGHPPTDAGHGGGHRGPDDEPAEDQRQRERGEADTARVGGGRRHDVDDPDAGAAAPG